ncbi:cyclase dehydrase [Azospirillum doebereinerae]|uniref:Cyclase dehydrase n=1 Tax=Azospirillum doebereinerae TaxID=92933 RepID=A0A3S0WRC4_9PROT|nr:cyclase dehydrase [Azospirillum doebereinerae]MCG5241624.1 cyclase dehydrase [Azospirillum doebereinerae]RUQ64063.1 cyclase dehydrase [Azospirillum doebereinerae]
MAYYRRGSSADAMARGMGWFSLGFGAAELVAGRGIARWLGMEQHTGLIRAYGVREITAGVGLLAMGDPKPWMWARVAGDVLDIATLATGLNDDNPRRRNVELALGAVAVATALDVLGSGMLHREEEEALTPPHDYSDRSGLPRAPDAMRGSAKDAPIPDELRTPKILQFHPIGMG